MKTAESRMDQLSDEMRALQSANAARANEMTALGEDIANLESEQHGIEQMIRSSEKRIAEIKQQMAGMLDAWNAG